MGLTLFNQPVNTLESSITGGAIPALNKKDLVVHWMRRLDPYDTPVVSMCGYGEPYNQDIMTFGQSYQVPFETTLGEDLTNVETDVDVAAGFGEIFYKYAVIAVTDYDAAGYLDHSTREIMVVTDVSGDTLTVDRGEGSTSAVVHTGTGDFPAQVMLIGTALPPNTDFERSPIARGDQFENYFQRFFGMVQADQAAENMPTWENESNVFLADAEETGRWLKIQLEKAIIYGGKQRTTTAAAGDLMGGLDSFIVTNVENLGGQNLSVYQIENVLRQQYKDVGENRATKLLMGPDTAALWDTTLNPYREAGMQDRSGTFVFDKIKLRWGTFDLAVSRHIPPGIIYGVRPEHIKIVPFAGCNWQTKDIETAGPYKKRAIWGQFSLRLEGERTMFKLHNFNQNFDNYARNEFF